MGVDYSGVLMFGCFVEYAGENIYESGIPFDEGMDCGMMDSYTCEGQFLTTVKFNGYLGRPKKLHDDFAEIDTEKHRSMIKSVIDEDPDFKRTSDIGWFVIPNVY